MKTLQTRFGLLVFSAIAAIMPGAAAQTVVQGTGNPDADIPAVQAAVNQGGQVVLEGHFSFNKPPAVQTALPIAVFPSATILIVKAVSISGVGTGDYMTSIEGGTIPFYIDAPGAAVSIQGLRFIDPTVSAILAYAATGLTIASCKIEGVVPLPKNGSIAIAIDTSGSVPTPTSPGEPANISGTVLVVDNDIDVAGGTDLDNTLGILIYSVGESPAMEADVTVSGNQIRNVTEPAINLRRIGGRASVVGNILTTGPISSTVNPGSDVIRIANTGSFEISGNVITSEWPDPGAVGIGVFSQFAAWPMQNAIVLGNDVTMSPPLGTVFVAESAGIDVRGFAQGNFVAGNWIHGQGRAALAVDDFKGGTPANNTFIGNLVDDFEASVADVFIDVGVTNTLLFGQPGTIEDHGVNTVIVQ